MEIQIAPQSNITKQQQLINHITRAIANHELEQGESLPSINHISKKIGISRDTVFKAYRELKRLNIVDSTPAKGYFVNRQLKKILLVLDYFSPFKDLLHNSFKKNLPSEYSIDLIFHHYNRGLFETIVNQNVGMYDFYVVMNPDTVDFSMNKTLKKIDSAKLLMLDIPIKNWNGFDSEKHAVIAQDFDNAVYRELKSIHPILKKYKSFNLVRSGNLNHPDVTMEYFTRFCYDHEITFNMIENIEKAGVGTGDAFFLLRQADLASLLRICKEKSYEPGKDIGILTYNDSPLYEFIGNGISVITTDFQEMGKSAAQFVIDKKTIKKTIPTKVKLRGSL